MVLIRAIAILLGSLTLAFGQAATNAFFNWETPPVHPVALSPNHSRLAVCNLPDNRVEIFNVSSGTPVSMGNIPVGLDPVSVKFRTDDEIWVANFISDSVSVASLTSMAVKASFNTLNEPSDIVFAGSPLQAYVSCAQPNTVQVFDPSSLNLVTNLSIAGNRPKAMTVSPDGLKVYAAIFESGNGSTIISRGITDPNATPQASPIDFTGGPYNGQNPPPNVGTNFFPAIDSTLRTNVPRVGLIVKKNAGKQWMDDNNGNWTSFVSGTNAVFTSRTPGWDVVDNDVAVIDTSNFGIKYNTGMMNICMDIAVNPGSGKLTVVGTDAINQIRFEPDLRGVFVRVNLAMGAEGSSSNTIVDLNSHLNYSTPTVSPTERNKSVGDPRGIIWNADGSRGYVTGMGSDNLIIINAQGQRVGQQPSLDLPSGPTGLALDEGRNRLYVLNRFAASVSVIDTASETVTGSVSFYDPTPLLVRNGRSHLYNTHTSSGLGQAACGSCHVDSRFDRLAWDLGNPVGTMSFVASNNINFGQFPPTVTNDFHPMKGPMVTQTLQDIIGHEPFHWRGDRTGLEQFNPTFTNLQAAPLLLTTNEMQDFENFLGTIRFAPNPFRNFDNSLSTNLALPGFTALGRGTLPAGQPLPRGNAQSGMTQFRQPNSTGCVHCHALPEGGGTDLRWTGTVWTSISVGPNGEHHSAEIELARNVGMPFKIAQLRSLPDKIGMDFTKTNSLSGFGFAHDGGVDTLTRFIQDGFGFRDDQVTADLIAFLLSVNGSDLPAGSFTDVNRPPGLPSNDTAAAVGRQLTISAAVHTPTLDSILALANNTTGRVELVVRGQKNGLNRGWFYDRPNARFQSDRQSETLLPDSLLALAAPGNELTYTLVPTGCGRRIGIDRDSDGYLDRDELDFGSDPANPLSLATNTAPTLSSIANVTIFKGQTLSFNPIATDADIPAQILTFSLGTNTPAGASISSTNGLFTWTPGPTQGPGTNSITVTVTDNGTPNLSSSKTFSIAVLELQLGAGQLGTNGFALNWNAIAGQTYRVQYKDHLEDPTWTDLPGDIPASGGAASKTDPTPNPAGDRFYRILLVR